MERKNIGVEVTVINHEEMLERILNGERDVYNLKFNPDGTFSDYHEDYFYCGKITDKGVVLLSGCDEVLHWDIMSDCRCSRTINIRTYDGLSIEGSNSIDYLADCMAGSRDYEVTNKLDDKYKKLSNGYEELIDRVNSGSSEEDLKEECGFDSVEIRRKDINTLKKSN